MLERLSKWRSTRTDVRPRLPLLAVRCAWCDDCVVVVGTLGADEGPRPAGAVSHGLCDDCRLQLEHPTQVSA